MWFHLVSTLRVGRFSSGSALAACRIVWPSIGPLLPGVQKLQGAAVATVPPTHIPFMNVEFIHVREGSESKSYKIQLWSLLPGIGNLGQHNACMALERCVMLHSTSVLLPTRHNYIRI